MDGDYNQNTSQGSDDSSQEPKHEVPLFIPVNGVSHISRHKSQLSGIVSNDRDDSLGGAVAAAADTTTQNLSLKLAVEEVKAVSIAGPAGLPAPQQKHFETEWAKYPVHTARPANVNELQREAISFFEKKGWSKEQSVGIVANLTTESGMNVGAVGDSGQAFGLGQWHPDRQRNFARAFGKDIKTATFEDQLSFVNHELTAGTEVRAGNMLLAATTAADAGAIISKNYERPADVQGNAHKRAQLAADIDAGLSKVASNNPDRNGLRVETASLTSGSLTASNTSPPAKPNGPTGRMSGFTNDSVG